jgi:hypothetical protein
MDRGPIQIEMKMASIFLNAKFLAQICWVRDDPNSLFFIEERNSV